MRSIETDLAHALSKESETLYLVNPLKEVLSTLTDAVDTNEANPHIRIISNRVSIKSTLKDFLIASPLADLVETNICSIRVLEDYDRNSMLVSNEGISTYSKANDSVVTTSQISNDPIATLRDALETEWIDADEFSLRIPGITRVRERLKADLGEEMWQNFDVILSNVEELRRRESKLDEVKVAVIAGARSEVLLYDVSHTGEDIGLASRATFSRTKQILEDRGIIETSKVPKEVGRPRLRLHLKDSELQAMDQEEFAKQVVARM